MKEEENEIRKQIKRLKIYVHRFGFFQNQKERVCNVALKDETVIICIKCGRVT